MYQISDEVIKNENENKRRLGIFGICLRNCYKGLCIAVWNWYLFFMVIGIVLMAGQYDEKILVSMSDEI